MAKTTVGAEVQVEYKSVGDMRKAIKEATGDVIRMQEQFGATSKEALAAAKRVTDLKDRIKDATEIADLFDPGNKFKALGNTVMVAANGFTALQGAMGLLGVESAEVEKQLLRVQSAMALTQSLSALADSGKDFSRLASIVKTQVVAAFTTLRGALMAVGIGLFTAAIAFLIQNFDKIKKVIYDTFPALEGLFDNFDRIKQIAYGVGNVIIQWVTTPIRALIKVIKGDMSGAIDEVKKSFQFTKNFREGEKKEIDRQAAEAEAARQEELKKQQEANNAKLKQQREAAEAAAKQRAIERQRRLAEIEEEERQALILKWKYELERKKVMDSIRQSTKLDEDFGRQERREKEAEDYQLWLAKRKEQQEKEQQLQLDYNAALQQADLDLYQAKGEIAEAGLNLLSAIAGRNKALSNSIFILERAFAIAKVIVNTQQEIAGYWANPTWSLLPDGGAALKTAMSVKAKIRAGVSIATIAATAIGRFMNGAGGGSSSLGPSMSTSAPVQAQLSTPAQAQLLNAQAINNMGNQAVQAYVLNSDIQNNNQVNAFLQRNASIG